MAVATHGRATRLPASVVRFDDFSYPSGPRLPSSMCRGLMSTCWLLGTRIAVAVSRRNGYPQSAGEPVSGVLHPISRTKGQDTGAWKRFLDLMSGSLVITIPVRAAKPASGANVLNSRPEEESTPSLSSYLVSQSIDIGGHLFPTWGDSQELIPDRSFLRRSAAMGELTGQ